MAAMFPGACNCVPSFAPMLIRRDITDKGHDWSNRTPFPQPQHSHLSGDSLTVANYTCTRCGIECYSLTSSTEYGLVEDKDKQSEGNAKWVKWVPAPAGIKLPELPERYIQTWDYGDDYAWGKLTCDELREQKSWLAVIDYDAPARAVAHCKEQIENINEWIAKTSGNDKDSWEKHLQFWKDRIQEYEEMDQINEIYKRGGYKVNVIGTRVTFMADSVAIRKIRGIDGVSVEER